MQSKHNAKFLDGRKRQAIITALANGESKRSIVRRLNVSNHTVDAVGEAEWQQVAARKERLAAQAELNATLAAEQITEHLQSGKQPLNILVPVFGVSIDKISALRAGPIQVNLSDTIEPSRNAWDRLNELAQMIEASVKPVSSPAQGPTPALLPNGESVPDSGAETGLKPENQIPKNGRAFTVGFYGQRIFCCKTAQICETWRESDSLGLPMKNTLCNAAKNCAKSSL
jgi:hypothetical protein